MKKIPLRMCVVCKEMKPKKELLRIVKNAEGKIFIDFTGKANGRGAYICNNLSCLQKCVKNKILNRVFETTIAEEIYTSLLEDFIGKA